jgi:cation diffusion facilitator family transporter
MGRSSEDSVWHGMMPNERTIPVRQGIRSAQLGLVLNAALATLKLVAGVVGNAYALVADAVESMADILGSVIVWGGLHVAAQPADEDHPFGHGKAEAIAAAVVAILLLGAGLGIGYEAVHGIRTPHVVPAPWTLAVLLGVVITKWVLSRRVGAIGEEIGSTAVRAEAWHHMSDAITSTAAFIGIGIAVIGSRLQSGVRWEAADDWAALFAAGVIAVNGARLLRLSFDDLMDRMPDTTVVGPVRALAEQVPGVLAIEKLHARKSGLLYRVTLHVQADGRMSLADGHMLGHTVQKAIIGAFPQVASVLVHMEPYQPRAPNS